MAFQSTDLWIATPAGRIAATLTRPESAPADMVVLMLHGYTGSRAEFPIAGSQKGFFDHAAARFAAAGLAALRIDFRGSGESDGRWRDTTIDGQAEDAHAALQALHVQLGFDRALTVLLGFSQGGLVALRAIDGGADVAAAVLWNPVLDPRRTYGGILGEASIAEGSRQAAEGRGGDLVGRTGLNADFFKQIAEARPLQSARVFRGPMLVISGTRDDVAVNGPELAGQLQAARAPARTDVVAVEADHGFDAGRGTGDIDAVIDCTLRFLSWVRRGGRPN